VLLRPQRRRVRGQPGAGHPDPENYGLADLAPFLEFGASPRASLGLVRAGRAMALMRGRSYVVPQDIFDVAPEILRHRLVLTYEALAQRHRGRPRSVVTGILSTVPAPRVAPSQHPDPAGPVTWGPDGRREGSTGTDGGWPSGR
jgi:MoxR-like ATPase